MAIKNTRTSVSNTDSIVEKRLKAKLKEDYNSFLKEDDEMEDDLAGLDDDMSDDDMGMDAEPAMGDEESAEDIELTPSQDEWMDSEVDALLGLGIEGAEEEISLDEDDSTMMMEDEFDGLQDDSIGDDDMGLDIEDDEFSADTDDSSELPGEFTADELNAIIDEPNTLDMLTTDLKQKAVAQDTDGMDDDFEDDGLGMGEDDDIDLEEALGLEESTDNLMEAELASSLEEIGYEEGEQGVGGAEDDYDNFPADLDFEATEHSGKAKVVTNGTEWEQGTPAKGSEITTMVKESVKKSKMLVKAAEAIVKLQEANARLQLANKQLNKVNGIFAAVDLSKVTRKKIAESFQACKSEKEINTLYSKVVGVITEKKSTTLNEAVGKTRASSIKKVATKLNENAAAQPQAKDITHEQKRKNFLMGMSGNEDMYFG